jgi:hypothetical protein
MNRKIILIISALSAVFANATTVTVGPNKEILIDGKPFFPLMTWLQNPSLIATDKGYGINTFVGQGDNSSALSYCDAAKAQGVYAVPSWNAAQVATVKSHQSMLGWVFGDEPDLQSNKVQPSAIKRQYDSIRAADPGHLAFLTTTSGFYSGDALPAWMNGSDTMYYSYPKYADIIGFDYYPVYGWCRPDWIYKVASSQDELVNKYCKGAKSTYQWIECVKTSGQWCSIAARGANDGPYPYEIRDEVWLAIIKGANAIGYFTHSWKCPGYSQCCVSDSQIAMLKKVNGQITALTPVLCGPDSKIALQVQINDPKGSVIFRAKQHGDTVYLIAAKVINLAGAKDTVQATITVPGLTGTVLVYDEKRTISPSGITLVDRFTTGDPVHIYAIMAMAAVRHEIGKISSSSQVITAYSHRDGSIRFVLPPGLTGDILIYDSSGKSIRRIGITDGCAIWHTDDGSGVKCGRGVYFASVRQTGTNPVSTPVILYR